MTPSEWAISRIEALSAHHRIFWVEDPYVLISEQDVQALTDKLSGQGRSLIAASSPFRLYVQLQNHDPASGHCVILDQSCTPRQAHLLPKDCKPSDFKPIIAPHWRSLLAKDAFFRPTIRDFLKFCTDDTRWPVEVDLYPYETLARQAPSRLVEAYESFTRTGRPLTSDDLVMIGASAVFRQDLLDISNPLAALEIAFHNQQEWEELGHYFNEGEVEAIRKRLASLPFPIGALFGTESDTARLAVTALVVLRQHTPEPGKLLPMLSPVLTPYQDCDIGLYTEAPPWFSQEEVPRFEKLLGKNFKKYLHDQFHLSGKEKATSFYQAEHHCQVLKEMVVFEISEPPSQPWQDPFALSNLVPMFMHTKRLLEDIYRSVKPLVEGFRLTAPKNQKLMRVKEIFVDKRMHLMDRFTGELHAFKRDIEGPARRKWQDIPGFEQRWKSEANAADTLMNEAALLLNDLDYLFGRLLEYRYSELIPSQAFTTDLFYREFIGPRRRKAAGGLQDATILMVDSLRYDVWSQVIRPMLEKDYEIEESFGLARLPSETRVSRRAFFSGKTPGLIPPGAESTLFINHLKEVHRRDFTGEQAPCREGMAFAAKTSDDGTYACVFDFTDRLSHEISWSPHKLQESIRPILHEMEAVLKEQGSNHMVFLTSDHGHIRMQKGSPVFIQASDVGYRSAYVQEKVEGKHAVHLFQIPAKTLGHNQPGWYVFPRPGFYLREDGKGRGRPEQNYRHGGISLFEAVVPLACLKHRSRSVKVHVQAEVKGKAEVSKTNELMISITTDGVLSSPVRIYADTDDVQPAYVTDISSIPKTISMRYRPSAPGKHTIKLKAALGETEVGEVACLVNVESAAVPEDPTAQKLRKIFGDL